MKILSPAELPQFLETCAAAYDLRVPIRLEDGGRVIGSILDGPLAMFGEAVPAKPTAFFFPQEEVIFTAGNPIGADLSHGLKRLFIIGFTPTDLRCLRFIDRFFAAGNPDDLYFALRDKAIVAAISGQCGSDGRFIPPAEGECDLEFIFTGTNWLLRPYSQIGTEIVSNLNDAPQTCLNELRAKSITGELSDNEDVIKRAAAILHRMEVPEEFWDEIGKRCIQCSGCNLVCPTCTCFGVQDWRYAERTERRRMWDSCQLAGFMREAGGHNPLATAALRTRRRIHHKLAADLERWGELSCFVCGRCDKTCPAGIGIIAVAREMLARFGNASGRTGEH